MVISCTDPREEEVVVKLRSGWVNFVFKQRGAAVEEGVLNLATWQTDLLMLVLLRSWAVLWGLRALLRGGVKVLATWADIFKRIS